MFAYRWTLEPKQQPPEPKHMKYYISGDDDDFVPPLVLGI